MLLTETKSLLMRLLYRSVIGRVVIWQCFRGVYLRTSPAVDRQPDGEEIHSKIVYKHVGEARVANQNKKRKNWKRRRKSLDGNNKKAGQIYPR